MGKEKFEPLWYVHNFGPKVEWLLEDVHIF